MNKEECIIYEALILSNELVNRLVSCIVDVELNYDD